MLRVDLRGAELRQAHCVDLNAFRTRQYGMLLSNLGRSLYFAD
jgi:hypothetical protein